LTISLEEEGREEIRGVDNTYKSLGLQNNNDSRFAIVINKKGRAELTLPFPSSNCI
jgi:hypothetical protein